MTETVNDPNPDNKEAPADQQSVLIDAKPAPVAPAVAPVVEAIVAAGPVAYEPTGDVGLDMALDFMGKAGLGSAHPAMVAATQGDFAILKATLAAKNTPGWEQFVALAESAYSRTTKESEAKVAASREAIFKEAGGEENWNAVKAWAGVNATDAEKAEVNALLNQGGLAARGAVQYLMGAYQRANNVEVNPRDPLANAARGGGASAADAGALSPRGYAEAVQQLNNKLGGRLEGSKEYADLQRRRGMFRG